jgi:hypothetical protein
MNQTDDAGFKIERTTKAENAGTQAQPVAAPVQQQTEVARNIAAPANQTQAKPA